MASAESTDDLARREGGSGQQPMLARHRQSEQPTAPTGHPPPAAGAGGYFPLGYKEGFSQWWAGLTPAQTEHRVLSFVPHLQSAPTHTQTGSMSAGEEREGAAGVGVDTRREREAEPVRSSSVTDPYGPRRWHSKLVQLAGKGKFLNEFSVERVGEETKQNLVMLHGYGAGLGFFYKNFDSLSRLPGWKLYALDLLGMGRSSRPPFRIHAKDKEGKVREAENWFIDALEEWRIKRGIDKMTLMGHSLGGYMAVCYSLKYPGHINKLILASPVGIPEDPYAVNEDMPEADSGALAASFAQSQDETAGATPARSDNNNFLNSADKRAAAEASGKPPRRQMPKWLTTLWDANISPFSIVRFAGPLGPKFVSGWTGRRFAHLPPDEAQALHDYSYSLFRQRGSGEYALAYVLAPGAFARSPLIRRIHGVGRQFLGAHPAPEVDAAPPASKDDGPAPAPSKGDDVVHRARETGIPIVFLYGDKDWMDKEGGHASAERIEAEKKRALATASEAERRAENGGVKTKVIRDAGHHVYLDGFEEFNRFVLEELKGVEGR